jgi:hypothetical protein
MKVVLIDTSEEAILAAIDLNNKYSILIFIVELKDSV